MIATSCYSLFQRFRVTVCLSLACIFGVLTAGSQGLGQRGGGYQELQLKFGSADLLQDGSIDHVRERMGVGAYLSTLEKHGQAEAQFAAALSILDSNDVQNDAAKIQPFLNLALEVSNQGRFVEADGLFFQARLLMQGTAQGDGVEQARLLSYLAAHEANRGRLATAASIARSATDFRLLKAESTVGSGVNQVVDPINQIYYGIPNDAAVIADLLSAEAVQSLLLEAQVYLTLQDYRSAQKVLGEADSLFKKVHVAPFWWRARMREMEAQALAGLGDFSAASRLAEIAVDLNELYFGETVPTVRAMLTQALIFERSGEVGMAQNVFGKAFVLSREGGIRWAPHEAASYLNILFPQAQSGNANSAAIAFEVLQIATANEISRDIARSAAISNVANADVQEQLRELQEKQRRRSSLLTKYAALSIDPAAVGQQEGLEQLATSINELQEEIDETAGQSGIFKAEKNSTFSMKVENLDEVRSHLAQGEALLVSLLAPNATYSGFVTRSSAHFNFALGAGTSEIRQNVDQLRKEFLFLNGGFDANGANVLYQATLSAFENSFTEVNSIAFVANDALLSFPMSAYVMERVDAIPVLVDGHGNRNGDYSSVKFVGTRFGTSVAPTVNSWLALKGLQQVPSNSGLAFGYFQKTRRLSADFENAYRSDSGCLNAARQIASLETLPGTAGSVLAFASNTQVPVLALTGDRFIEQNVLSTNLRQASSVMFASHALLPNDDDCFGEAGILTSFPLTNSASRFDGILGVSEIIDRFDLANTNLVILSGCDTGGPADLRNGFSSGEALNGLARAFMSKGALAVLSTHWTLSDNAAVRFEQEFFGQVGIPINQALLSTRRKFVEGKRLSHPFYWANFDFIGDASKPLAL